MKNNQDIIRLKHIMDAGDELESYLSGKNEADFYQDTMLQSACIRQLEIIGEAAGRLSKELVQKHDKIEWKEIIGLRNLLIHEYFGVDMQIVWNILIFDIPIFKKRINAILDSMS